MTEFGRLFDLVVALLCMFILPFAYFQNAGLAAAERNASKRADAFLECVQNSAVITEKMYKDFCKSNIIVNGRSICEIEIERKEYLPQSIGGIQTVSYSSDELEAVIESQGSLKLRSGDCVKLRVYCMTNSGGRRLMTNQGRLVK